MKRLLREPLLHFLLLGGLLFALQAARGDGEVRAEEIRVSAGDIEHLRTMFERTWMRPPTDTELDGLIDDHVRSEAAWREARAIGLDRDDAVLRRRLRQKLEFLAEDLAAQAQPSEAELERYLETHVDVFRDEGRTSFRQIYFSRQARGSATEADARAALARLLDGPAGEAGELGDASLLPEELALARASEIDAQFGAAFSAGLAALAPGVWSGPLESSYGLHLVLVTEREPGRVPALAEVRAAVEREWFAERRKQGIEDFDRGLLERYQLSIEGRPAAAEPAER